jgi:hypothetical protein
VKLRKRERERERERQRDRDREKQFLSFVTINGIPSMKMEKSHGQ